MTTFDVAELKAACSSAPSEETVEAVARAIENEMERQRREATGLGWNEHAIARAAVAAYHAELVKGK